MNLHMSPTLARPIRYGWTALHKASQNNHAQVNAISLLCAQYIITIVHNNNFAHVARALLEHGADANKIDLSCVQPSNPISTPFSTRRVIPF
jgi:hypothetical protein